MLKVLLSVVVSLAPARYRRTWFGDADLDVKRGAVLSGALQAAGAGVALYLRYPLYLIHRHEFLEQLARPRNEYEAIQLAYRGVTYWTFIEYLLLPGTMLLIYVAIEGLVRLAAAVVTGEVVATLPLALLGGVHTALERRQRERALGPRIVDEVMTGISPEYDLRIDSCRPKPWTPLTTIRYRDELFELNKQLQGLPPRPYVYMLRRMPRNKIVRGLHEYQPEETLRVEE